MAVPFPRGSDDVPASPSDAARRAAGSQEAGDAPRDTAGSTGAGATGGRPRSAPPRRAAASSLEGRLSDMFSAPALAFSLAGDQHCANIIATGAPEMARAWAKLASENASVRRILNQLLEGSAWGAVVISTLSVAVPIAAHHGMKIPGPFGAAQRKSEPAAAPRSGFGGWGQPRSAAKPSTEPVASAEHVGPSDDARQNSGEDVPPVYLDGAPPGVVTVAHGPAAHAGAR